jgi:hypothetical protein
MALIEPQPNHDRSRWETLRSQNLMVVLDIGGAHLPRVVYWGSDLGEISDEETAALPLASEKTGPRPADVGVPLALCVGEGHYDVEGLMSLLPVPEDTVEILDFTGRWADEAQPQRRLVAKRLKLPGEGPGSPGGKARPAVDAAIAPGSVLIGPGLEAPVLPPEGAARFRLTKQAN